MTIFFKNDKNDKKHNGENDKKITIMTKTDKNDKRTKNDQK